MFRKEVYRSNLSFSRNAFWAQRPRNIISDFFSSQTSNTQLQRLNPKKEEDQQIQHYTQSLYLYRLEKENKREYGNNICMLSIRL